MIYLSKKILVLSIITSIHLKQSFWASFFIFPDCLDSLFNTLYFSMKFLLQTYGLLIFLKWYYINISVILEYLEGRDQMMCSFPSYCVSRDTQHKLDWLKINIWIIPEEAPSFNHKLICYWPVHPRPERWNWTFFFLMITSITDNQRFTFINEYHNNFFVTCRSQLRVNTGS